MKLFATKKRAAAIGALTAATLIGGGVAFAYWTAGGTGSGSATTAGGLPSLTITQLSTVTDMYPGDSTQALTVRVRNDAASRAYVTSLGAWITTSNPGCDGTDYLINGHSDGDATTPTPLTWSPQELASGGASDSANTLQFNAKAGTDQDACKGAGVTVHYVAQ